MTQFTMTPGTRNKSCLNPVGYFVSATLTALDFAFVFKQSVIYYF